MPRGTPDEENGLYPEIRHTLRALRYTINVATSVQVISQFRDSIQNSNQDWRIRDLITMIDQRIQTLHEENVQAVDRAQLAFHQLTARNRRKMRAYYRDDLRTFLDIYLSDGPLEIFGERFQETQAALFRAVDLRRKLLHLRRLRLIIPHTIQALRLPKIEELMQENQREVTSLEHDQTTAERLLNLRFQSLSEDEQNVFWKWYENDMKACGIQRIAGTPYFRFTAMRPAIVVTQFD